MRLFTSFHPAGLAGLAGLGELENDPFKKVI